MIQNIEHEVVVYNKRHDTLEVIIGSSLFFISDETRFRFFPIVTVSEIGTTYLSQETFLEDYEIFGEI